MWGISLLHFTLLGPQRGLFSMYLSVTSVSIGKTSGKILKMCETNTVCGVKFGHVCSQKIARDLCSVSGGMLQ
jgi:hypothetical protein